MLAAVEALTSQLSWAYGGKLWLFRAGASNPFLQFRHNMSVSSMLQSTSEAWMLFQTFLMQRSVLTLQLGESMYASRLHQAEPVWSGFHSFITLVVGVLRSAASFEHVATYSLKCFFFFSRNFCTRTIKDAFLYYWVTNAFEFKFLACALLATKLKLHKELTLW